MADRDGDRKSSLFSQVAPAVVIALLVGTSSPWWLKLFRSDDADSSTGSQRPPATQPVAEPGAPGTSSSGSQQQGSATPGDNSPAPDFPGGSRPVYGAQFSKWPVQTNEHGVTRADQGEYILEPNSNTWVGPGKLVDIAPLEGNFVLDVNFRVEQRDPGAALELELYGAGVVANSVSVFLEIWNEYRATYSLQTGTLKENFYAGLDKEIASRAPLPPPVMTHDWSKRSKLTLRREGGTAHLFVNDVYVTSFPLAIFTVSRLSIGAAFKSRIVISSIEARVP